MPSSKPPTKRLFESSKALKDALAGFPNITKELAFRNVGTIPCIVAHSYRALIRTVGFFKYNHQHPVVLRGQIRCYQAMQSSLDRRSPTPSDKEVEQFLERYRTEFNVDQKAHEMLSTEPLLQHYGIATRWVDVVDSVPHALFFATHQFVKSPHDPTLHTYVPSREEHGFIYILSVGKLKPVTRAGSVVTGYSRGADLLVADLRKLKPSIALRPHAQHGLLIKNTTGSKELWDRIVARIAVPSREARRWIASEAFHPTELFPTRKWDGIYSGLLSDRMTNLLNAEVKVGRRWGEITRYDFHES